MRAPILESRNLLDFPAEGSVLDSVTNHQVNFCRIKAHLCLRVHKQSRNQVLGRAPRNCNPPDLVEPHSPWCQAGLAPTCFGSLGAGLTWAGSVSSLGSEGGHLSPLPVLLQTHLSRAIRHDLFMLPLLTAPRYSESNFTGSKLSHQLSKAENIA